MTAIYLVQHGDKERMPGDPGLTELGRGRAAVTARWRQGTGLHALYSSPLRRARETAEPIGQATGLAIQVDSRLRERLNWDGSQAFDAFLAGWDRSAKDRDLLLGNGESSRSAGERLRVFLASLAGASGPVAIVSHGGLTTDLLRTLLGDDELPPRLMNIAGPGQRERRVASPARGRNKHHGSFGINTPNAEPGAPAAACPSEV